MDRSPLYKEPGFYLYTEERARIDAEGYLLPAEQAPDDGLCRVIVDSHATGLPTDRQGLEEWVWANRWPACSSGMVALAVANLAGPTGWLWRVDELKLRDVDRLEEALGRKIARMPDMRRTFGPAPGGGYQRTRYEDLIVLRQPCREMGLTPLWPPSSRSNHVFAFNEIGTELDRDLQRLEQATLEGADDALTRWDAIELITDQRGAILELCHNCVAVILPYGPHGDHAGVYSTRVAVGAIVDAFRAVADQAGLACVEIPNLTDECNVLHR
ncbi:MAG TPA: hypothetical protein VGM37_11395 [Armatimonadota bacterium]|jgi:hypothetical protein